MKRVVKGTEAKIWNHLMSPTIVPTKPKLLEQMRDKLRVLHYVWKTEKSYVAWVEKNLRYHKDRNCGVWRHPTELG